MNKILIWLLVVMTITTTLARSGRDGQRRKKTMKPNKYSEKYDEKTIALEFDDECLKENGKDENEMMLELLSLYPCLSNKEVYTDGTVFRHHGKIKRTYMKITSDSSSNKKRGKANNEEFFLTEKNCLENSTDEIDWDDYCIEDISYDMTLYLEGICIDDVTNGIYYDLTKKADAWNLDMMDGKIDSRFKRPNIGALGSDNGIDIWILDSGIYKEHNEFYSGQIIDEVPSYTYTSKHGTNSASVAGGNHYGSSKGFYIHDYIVCRNSDGGCSFSDIDKGLQAVLAHMRKTGRRSIINMSIGSSGANNYASTQSYYESLFADINNAGGIIVVSAGNSNTDACNWWFSYSDKVVSVGAHDKNKKRSTFSNYGPCVDIYAPGTSVPAANSISDPTVVGYVSGTSFASPMMAGIIANLLYEDRTRTKDQIVSLLRSTANRYQITNCPSGYCYGFGYKCSILSANGIESEDDDEDDDDGDEGDEGDQDDQNEYEEDYDHDDNIEGIEDFNQNNGIEDNGNIEGEVSSMGCCKTLRSELKRLEQYCSSLSIDDCLSGENIDYCFVDTQC